MTHCYNATAVSKTGTVIVRSCLDPPSGTSVGCKTTTIGTGVNELKITTCYCTTDNCNHGMNISERNGKMIEM